MSSENGKKWDRPTKRGFSSNNDNPPLIGNASLTLLGSSASMDRIKIICGEQVFLRSTNEWKCQDDIGNTSSGIEK